MAQYTQQFLNSVLSQSGPTSLPYSEPTKWHIRQHLLNLTESYPSLQPKTAIFTHNDGRTVSLLQADGTIPMSFHNVTYNIPIIIWLMESYPHHAPLVFLNPTRDMIIKRPHPFVSPNGVVSIPYLHSWVFPSSNLVELCRNLSHYFARDPPLYSQRKSNSNSNVVNPINTSSSLNYSNTLNNVVTPPTMLNSPLIPPPYGYNSNSNSNSSNRLVDEAAEVFKRNAVNSLVEKCNSDIREMRRAKEVEVEGLFSVQGVLRKRDEELGKGVKEMSDEKEALEQQLQMVLMNSDVLEGWLRENHGKGGKSGGDVDEAFETSDGLSKQMLECTAMDLAVEDTVYALDKAVQEGVVPFDQYLRTVRLLSREQFFHRATGSKVRAVQMQAQVASMASRAPPQVQYSF